MTFGLRGKLFAVSIAVVILGVAAGGIYLSRQLRRSMNERIERELQRQAAIAQVYLEAVADHSVTNLDAIADRLGRAARVRVTVIGPDGAVLGDSELTPAQIATVENHANRPEVIEALATREGSARRYSTTIDTEMLYVALPYHHDSRLGVVRVAKPLAEVDDVLGRLRMLLLLAGLVGLLVAAAMSALASHLMSRTLRELVVGAHALATSRTRARVDVPGRDELHGLAGSLNQLADELERSVGELASERARFGAVLEGMTDAVVGLNAERCVTVVNAAALELLGLEEAPLGEPLIEHIRAPELDKLITDLERPGQAELELSATGKRMLAQLAPQEGGGCVLVFRDVTDIRRLETVRRDFVANVSHELRTPVSIVRANAETLLDGAASDPVHGPRLLEAVHRNAERLSRILADLLDLSRLDAGAYKLEIADVSVASAASKAAAAVERAAADKGTTLVLDIDGDASVRADPKALDQILVNYLENAIKYTPAGGRIEVGVRTTGASTRIEVRDNGAGIAPHHRERLFERFYRVDPGRSRDMGGTGLGLSIVKHLAENMGGQVGVEPRDPQGSIFWCELSSAG